MSAPVPSRGRATGTGIIGVGTDLCSVERMAAALQRTPGLAPRVFTGAEMAALDLLDDGDLARAAAELFAIKEAVMKALGRGFGSIPFDGIEVERDGVTVRLLGAALQRAESLGVRSLSVESELLAGTAAPTVLASVVAS